MKDEAGGPKLPIEAGPPTPSFIQQLLRELSYDGAAISRYRQGGLGMENVLTAEVLQGLNFLPRDYFFKTFVESLKGEIGPTRAKLLKEAEKTSFRFLPGAFPFEPSAKFDHTMTVNPDGIIETPSVYAFVEAKRIKSSSFQAHQLGREYVVTVREAGDRMPLLLLILGKEPPVKIARGGRQEVAEAINGSLEAVLKIIKPPPRPLPELVKLIKPSVAWITWQAISDLLKEQAVSFRAKRGASVSACNAVDRIVLSVTDAIKIHA
jgi:hypothetical protein